MAMGVVYRPEHISRDWVRRDRRSLFVFGDNMIGKGRAGQAAAMRGEPNAVGIPTKWKPDNSPGAFFCDDDWNDGNVRHAIFEAFERIENAIADGRNVVIPAKGIGTGLAQLLTRAPKIYAYIEGRIDSITRASSPTPR